MQMIRNNTLYTLKHYFKTTNENNVKFTCRSILAIKHKINTRFKKIKNPYQKLEISLQPNILLYNKLVLERVL